jgi:DNA invertase Pin-like site-specific DNA recombinase
VTPQQKVAAGMGVVGYLRISSRGQTEGWSLEQQERAIRDWAQPQGIPVIAIESAPDGYEGGAVGFDDRVGWQAVERHVATGKVGWVAVAAIDRLSRDLGQLSGQIWTWEEQGIAIVAPGLGYGDPAGVGRFLLQLWGMLAEHERARLISRILPGMSARLQSGLPLGPMPLGYRVEAAAPVAGRRTARRLVPDPATAPVVVALFRQAVAQPTWGDRVMARWAERQWPQLGWTHGRVAGILENGIYTGVLRGSVQGEAVVILDNHTPVVSAAEFAQVQALRAQRARDLEMGLNAVSAPSWLGGIVRCGSCGGRVTWQTSTQPDGGAVRSDAALRGRYVCSGRSASAAEGPAKPACGKTWMQDIETFVWRAVEYLLEQGRSDLRALVNDAVELIPSLLDERRRQAAAQRAAADVDEERLTDDLAAGRISQQDFLAACERSGAQRTAAQVMLEETDGWSYLARLVTVRDGPSGGSKRWLSIADAWGMLDSAERRRLLHAVAERVALTDPVSWEKREAPEDPAAGRFTGVTVTGWSGTKGRSMLALGLARALVQRPGWDLAAGLRATGWEPEPETGGTEWQQVADERRIRLVPVELDAEATDSTAGG